MRFGLGFLQFVANDVFAGIFEGYLGTGLEGGRGISRSQ